MGLIKIRILASMDHTIHTLCFPDSGMYWVIVPRYQALSSGQSTRICRPTKASGDRQYAKSYLCECSKVWKMGSI